LAAGADPNLTDPHGTSPLTATIKNTWRGSNEDRLEIIRLLIDNGANVNQRSHQNSFDCPFAAAIMEDDFTIIELLIENGVDLSIPLHKSRFGVTYPLDYAVKLNKINAIKILNNHGAPKNSK